ncbi:DUF1493 family protein [Microbulbifer bruguierae]|uniref:DUF1493 family protein n=1 Tax=Microbulbifer bruguierae TaxID=3029061 RepID=A0ABY8NG09_9GAMM|nr:DUF1493 family protein [Microbulbifer bruguierae]WGL16667.1 DUF1493 family protein [Microbulbifer bruguierae]
MEPEIIKFLSEFTAIKPEKISGDTLVNFDLGVDGDDGVELLQEYAKKFNVDIGGISESYFGPEGVPLLWPFNFIRLLLGYRPSSLVPLPVSQLVKSAEAGKWVNM